MTTTKEKVKAAVDNALEQAERYFENTNQILGVLAVGIGLSCFSSNNIKFYAWFSLFFLVLDWGASFTGFKRRLEMLKNINHPKMTPWYIIKRCYVAFIGFGFLYAIAYGYLDKDGWKGW